MEWDESVDGPNILKDIRPLSRDILLLLKDDELNIFKKTSLYINHFSAEYVVFTTSESKLTLRSENTPNKYVDIYYNIFEYNGELDYFFKYKDNLNLIFIKFITKYLQCKYKTFCDEVDFDFRYYKDHPGDIIIDVRYQYGDRIGDYIYWLIQGNEPRWMLTANYEDPTKLIPSSIIYLTLGHLCQDEDENGNRAEECYQLTIPPQILFLEYNCQLTNINKNNFIAIEYVPNLWTNEEYDIVNNSALVLSAFYNYTFNKQSTKSARNNQA